MTVLKGGPAVALAVLLVLTGCGSRSPGSTGAATSTAPSSPSASPSAGPLYRLSTSNEVCAAIKAKLQVIAVETRKDYDHTTGCSANLGPDEKKHNYSLHVNYGRSPSAAEGKYGFDHSKSLNLAGQYSAFTKAPVNHFDIAQVGQSKAGQQYDEGYFVFYDPVNVAGIAFSQGVVVLRRGNVALTVDLLANDRTGSKATDVKPAKPDVSKKMFDDIIDSLLALIKT